MLDTAFAIVRRAGRRGNPAKADKDHLHHRLMRLGHGQRRSVLILWAWTALLSALVLYPTYTNKGNAIIPFAVAALGVAALHRLRPLGAPGRRGGQERAGRPSVEAVARPQDAAAGRRSPSGQRENHQRLGASGGPPGGRVD